MHSVISSLGNVSLFFGGKGCHKTHISIKLDSGKAQWIETTCLKKSRTNQEDTDCPGWDL